MVKTIRDHSRNRAIVIGGSIAGLLAARSLSDHFRHVMLLERDDLADGDVYRSGVPQAHHGHALLASGSPIFESYFPGLSFELENVGAIRGDVAQNVRWFLEGGRLVRFASGFEGFAMSRSLFERLVRAHTRVAPNITIQGKTRVDGLLLTADNLRVVGVKSGNIAYDADLVVDASGRGSRSFRWLEAHGYQRPPEERIEIDLRYTTRLFRRHSGDLGGDHAAIIPPTYWCKRGGVVIAQEDGRWLVTLVTQFGDFAPSDLKGFVEFSRSLPDQSIYHAIRDAEPVGEAHTIRIPASVRRRYELIKRFPAGYLVIGDAISSFNPIYGQGMSVAALQAKALGDVLSKRRSNVSRPFFRRAAKIVDMAWTIAAGNDLRMREAVGKRHLGLRLTNLYVPNLLRAGHDNPTAARAFLKVSNLLATPQTLLRPSLIFQAMRARFLPPQPSVNDASSDATREMDEIA